MLGVSFENNLLEQWKYFEYLGTSDFKSSIVKIYQ